MTPTPPRPWRPLLAVVLAPLLLAAASNPPTPTAAPCFEPQLERLADGYARTTLDVMTYNIEGLAFPARMNRGPRLAAIGKQLAALRQTGDAPDIVLFQEVFSDAARNAVTIAGYPHTIHGPGRGHKRALPAAKAVRVGAGRRSFKRGEIGLKFTSGGLAIASRYPIEMHKSEPFASKSCAGFDCLANKGALFARVMLPGVPDPIDIFDTHMNSRTASGAPPRRTLPIHHAQAGELASFIDAVNNVGNPTLLGGDFNMRRSEARFDFLEPLLPLTLVRRFCQTLGSGCDVRMSSDGDAPWMDTQDLQFFRSGTRVQVRPIRIEALFDGSTDSPQLSDHDAVRVVYELTWPSPDTTQAKLCGKREEPQQSAQRASATHSSL
ncbi:endonuclease/exonuclease/phosphatase family protein [Phenylobacterium sp. LjRoot219]|uniref:endonuclease/exonuclease/phosphatase family protein n=1 Tax=Phenylobacterium sp. LjRoot219 TaxID=3342283 RepID=UPI003ED0E692